MADSGITAEQFAKWLTPRQALRIVQQALPDIGVASRTIMEHLHGAQLLAGAKSSSREGSGAFTSVVAIPTHYWTALSGTKGEWWDTGVIRIFLRNNGTVIRYFGVRFEPGGVQAIIADLPKLAPPKTVAVVAGMSATEAASSPLSPAPAQSVVVVPTEVKPSPPLNNVGRPSKPYWDELWIEMCRQIYNGQLDSTDLSVAKIANAMMDWSSMKYPNDALSESTAKRAARRLSDALKRGS